MHEYEAGHEGPWGWRLLVLLVTSLIAEVRRVIAARSGTDVAVVTGVVRTQHDNEGE